MPETIFLPYRYEESAIQVHTARIALDERSVDPAQIVSRELRSITLHGTEPWDRAQLDLVITDPNRQADQALQDGESLEGAARLVAVLRNSRSRYREAIPLHPNGKGEWVAPVSLQRSMHEGQTRLQIFVIRLRNGKAISDRARYAGERIGGSEPWTIYIDEKAPVPGSSIDNEWRDFAQDPSPELRRRKDSVWYVDLSSPSRPRLLLNEGIPGLRGLLSSEQVRGRKAAARTALVTAIVQPVLLTLATFVLEGNPEEMPEPDGWQMKLMEALAQLSEKGSPEVLVESWFKAWRQADCTTVLSELQLLAQRHVALAAAGERLAKSVVEDSGNE